MAALTIRNRRRMSLTEKRVRSALRATTSRAGICANITPLHDASARTVMLRTGIRLGLVSPVNFASAAIGDQS